jgi:hypothetical protein
MHGFFKPLPIEIIAGQKVGPAFEPQELSWVDVGLTKIEQEGVARPGPPVASARFCLAT